MEEKALHRSSTEAAHEQPVVSAKRRRQPHVDWLRRLALRGDIGRLVRPRARRCGATVHLLFLACRVLGALALRLALTLDLVAGSRLYEPSAVLTLVLGIAIMYLW